MEIFGPITIYDLMYAAVAALGITFLITRFGSMNKQVLNQPTKPMQEVDAEAFLAQCRKLFPQNTIQYSGHTYESGDMVRVVTMQNRVIEGELIGQNDQQVICIRTRQNFIAQKLAKIMEISILEQKKQR